MSASAKEWFRNEVYFWRCLHFAKNLLLLQALLTPVALIVLQFSVWHPLQGPYQWLTSYMTASTLWYHLLSIMATLVLSLYHIANVEVALTVHASRLRQLWQYANPRSLAHAVLHAFLGGVAVRALLGLSQGRYSELVVGCGGAERHRCLNEGHTFLVLHGVFTGVLLHLRRLSGRQHCLLFPVIQLKFANARSQVNLVFRKAVLDCLKSCYVFYGLYYLLGSIPKGWISYNLGLDMWAEGSLQSLGVLLDLGLLWAVVCTGATLRAVEELALYLRDVCFTERLQFPVGVQYEAERVKQLVQAMGSQDCPLLHCLAFLDLRHLAEYSPRRRAQVFAISTPGGHPLHWNALCETCLGLVRSFSKALSDTEAPPPLKATPTFATQPALPSAPNESLARMRKLVPERQPPGTMMSPLSPGAPKPPVVEPPLLVKAVEALKKKPIVAYFVAELPEVKSRTLFAQCQPLIWAIEGLCLLVCASYKEDKYGVVQATLPDILATLLDTEQVLEKHLKRCASLRRTANAGTSREVLLRRSLAASLSSGLYQIACTFNKHLGGLNLAEEQRRRLKQFVDFNR
ncbi:nucleoporin NDC1 [Ixodes scapularis]